MGEKYYRIDELVFKLSFPEKDGAPDYNSSDGKSFRVTNMVTDITNFGLPFKLFLFLLEHPSKSSGEQPEEQPDDWHYLSSIEIDGEYPFEKRKNFFRRIRPVLGENGAVLLEVEKPRARFHSEKDGCALFYLTRHQAESLAESLKKGLTLEEALQSIPPEPVVEPKRPQLDDKLFDNAAYLRTICSMLPMADFFDFSGSSVPLRSLYLHRRFTEMGIWGDAPAVPLKNVVAQLKASEGVHLGDTNLVFIIGPSGGGKSTVISAIELACVLSRNGEDRAWLELDDAKGEEFIFHDHLVFDMNIADIADYACEGDFFSYVRECIKMVVKRNRAEKEYPQENINKLCEYIEAVCKWEERDVIFMIRSPERFEATEGSSAEEKREHLWASLSEVLDSCRRVKAICSTTEYVYGRIQHDRFSKPKAYSMQPLDAELIKDYTRKWLEVFTPEEADEPAPRRDSRINRRTNELITLIESNNELKDYTMSGVQALSLFLAAATQENGYRFNTQTHMLKIISRAAIGALMSSNDKSDDRSERKAQSHDTYDFITLLSLLCLNAANNETVRFSRKDIDALYEPNVKERRSMSLFLTEDSNRERFIELLGKFPFVQCTEGDYSIIPVWRDYYAAYAIARGLFRAEGRYHGERIGNFVNNTMKMLRDNEKLSDDTATMWVNILATAAKLCRENAEVFVPVLERYAASFAPNRRRGRELAVIIMLKLLRNRCFVSDQCRDDLLHRSLSYFLYHKQTEDLDALFAQSVYRKTFINMIFDEFFASITEETLLPIPIFHFTVGYLALNYVILMGWDGSLGGIKESVQRNTLSGLNQINRNTHFLYGLARAGSLASLPDWDDNGRIVFALALNSMTWLELRGDISIGQLQADGKSRQGDKQISERKEQLAGLLIMLINSTVVGEDAFQVVNALGYSLSHILAAERAKGEVLTVAGRLLESPTLPNLLLADYAARRAYDEKVRTEQESGGTLDKDIQPYCGALRALVLLEPTPERINECSNELKKQLKSDPKRQGTDIAGYYADLWARYLSEYTQDGGDAKQSEEQREQREDIKNNAARYLMLLFRPCILAGAFAGRQAQLEAIELLWQLKGYSGTPADYETLPGPGKTVGLQYDHEEYFYTYLLGLYKAISENLRAL